MTSRSGASGPTAFSPDNRLLAVGCLDGSVLLWDLKNQEEVFHRRAHGQGVEQVEFSPDGAVLASREEKSSAIQLLDLAGLRRRLAEIGLDW